MSYAMTGVCNARSAMYVGYRQGEVLGKRILD